MSKPKEELIDLITSPLRPIIPPSFETDVIMMVNRITAYPKSRKKNIILLLKLIEAEKSRAVKETEDSVAICPQCNDWLERKPVNDRGDYEYFCFGCDKTFKLQGKKRG